MFKTKREANRKKSLERFKKMHIDYVEKNMAWEDIAEKYGYKNAQSANKQYYMFRKKFINEL